jgi:predicted enzyme related to lactoylglutathione lyase
MSPPRSYRETAGRLEEEMNQFDQNNRIDYIELPANATDAVKKFYSRVFDWKFTDFGPDYASFEDGRMRGGFNADDGEKLPPLVVIYARDLEASRDAVVSAGGRIRDDIFDFPGGRRFHFFDPAGNVLGVWSDARS